MDYNRIDYERVRNYINKKYLFSTNGDYSIIYKYNNIIYKILKYYSKDYDRYDFFTKIKVDSVSFPNKLIVKDNVIRGYTYNFMEGKPFSSLDLNINPRDILENIDQIEKDVKILSDLRILISDLHDSNILFNSEDNTIKLIDTDEYGIDLPINCDCYIKNIRSLRVVLYVLLFKIIPLSTFVLDNNDISTKDAFENQIKIYEEEQEKNIDTIKELRLVHSNKFRNKNNIY